MWPKNVWKRIPHLMQQHETPRKGQSTINLHELIKSKSNPKKKIKRANTPTTFKVAEHSFRARFRSRNSARAQGFQKTNMPSIERSLYLLKTRTRCVIFL